MQTSKLFDILYKIHWISFSLILFAHLISFLMGALNNVFLFLSTIMLAKIILYIFYKKIKLSFYVNILLNIIIVLFCVFATIFISPYFVLLLTTTITDCCLFAWNCKKDISITLNKRYIWISILLFPTLLIMYCLISFVVSYLRFNDFDPIFPIITLISILTVIISIFCLVLKIFKSKYFNLLGCSLYSLIYCAQIIVILCLIFASL